MVKWQKCLMSLAAVFVLSAHAAWADSIRLDSASPIDLKGKLNEGPKPVTFRISYGLQSADVARIELQIQQSTGSDTYIIAGNISAQQTASATATVDVPISLFINPANQEETVASAADKARGLLPPGGYEYYEANGYGASWGEAPAIGGGSGSGGEASDSVSVVAKLITYNGTLLAIARSYFLIPSGGSVTVTSNNHSSLDVATCALAVNSIDPNSDGDEALQLVTTLSGVGKVDVYVLFVVPNGSFYSLKSLGTGSFPDSFAAANEVRPLAVDLPLDAVSIGSETNQPGFYNVPIFQCPTGIFPAGTYGLYLILTQPGSNLSEETNWLASDSVKWRVWANPGPELFLEFPTAGYTTTENEVEFIGTASDIDGIAGVIVNGTVADLIDLDAGAANGCPRRARWRITLPFTNGENRSATVSAYDSYGNTTYNAVSANVRVMEDGYESAAESRAWPTITILTPNAGRQYYVGERVHVTGVIHDNDGLDSVIINGTTIEADGGNEGILPLSMGSPRNDPADNPSSYPLQLWAVDSTVLRLYNVRTIGCQEGDLVRWSSTEQAFVPAMADTGRNMQIIGIVINVRPLLDENGNAMHYDCFEDGVTRTNLGHANILLSGYVNMDSWKLQTGTQFITPATGTVVSGAPEGAPAVSGTFRAEVIALNSPHIAITGQSTLAVGQSTTLVAKYVNAATHGTLSLASSNPAIASVMSNGVVTALAIGTVSITASDSGGTIANTRFDLTVVTGATDVAAITGTTPIERTLTAPFSARGLGAITYTFTWSSGTASVATVSTTGVVTGVDNGVVTITTNGAPASSQTLGSAYYLHPSIPGGMCTSAEYAALRGPNSPATAVAAGVAVTPTTLAIGKAASIAWGEEFYVGTVPTSGSSSDDEDVTILPTPMYDGFFQLDVDLTEGPKKMIRIGSRDLLGNYYHDVATIWVRVLDTATQDENSGNGDAITGGTEEAAK
mgnify:CR=1 FL=1